MSYRIVKYNKDTLQYLPHNEQPFDIVGRLVPMYNGVEWTISEELFEEQGEKTYPNDTYDPATYIDNNEEAVFLAFNNDKRIGSIRVCKRWNGNAFIDDLKVDRAYRRKGVGKLLMDSAVQWSKEKDSMGCRLKHRIQICLHADFTLNMDLSWVE